jgi:hypothetical protein
MPQLRVGAAVHYASHGTANGEFPKACRAAVVTETYDDHHHGQGVVSLAVLTPWAVEFRRDIRQGTPSRAQPPTDLCAGLDYPGGSWHWPAT